MFLIFYEDQACFLQSVLQFSMINHINQRTYIFGHNLQEKRFPATSKTMPQNVIATSTKNSCDMHMDTKKKCIKVAGHFACGIAQCAEEALIHIIQENNHTEICAITTPQLHFFTSKFKENLRTLQGLLNIFKEFSLIY